MAAFGEGKTMAERECPECGGGEFYSSEVTAKGGYGPDLLPGIGWCWFPTRAKFRLCVCGHCGYVKWFVPQRFLDDIKTKGQFQRMA